jgi:hypothetical protein
MAMRIIVIAACCLVSTGALAQSAAQPLPEVRVVGPLPVTADSYPFGAADHTRVPQDVKKVGYVEEEFLVSGVANVYDWPADGPARVRTANAPYTTRVLIRRPASRARFSGTVILEPLNPSNRFDLNIGWAISHAQFIRNGDAWVGVTTKPVSVAAMKAFNPARYAALSWANPLPENDPLNCTMVAGDSARTTENGLIWDVLRQVGSWVKGRDNANPLAYGQRNQAPVRRLYAWGYSQSGNFLITYLNAIHPLDVRAYGKPLFDAYFIAVPVGLSAIHQCAQAPPPGDPRRAIASAGVPVMRVVTLSEYLRAEKRPDSDTAPNLFRHYEVAGAAHATPDELNFAAAPADITKAGIPVPPMECNEGPRSRFPNSVAFNAALRNLDEWVRKGTAAPRAEPILVENGKPVLDEHGNVRGGVRSPYVDVPTSAWTGSSTGASFCFIAGHEVPLSREQLRSLYPTHDAYVAAVRRNVDDLVSRRFIVRQDGEELIREADRSRIP